MQTAIRSSCPEILGQNVAVCGYELRSQQLDSLALGVLLSYEETSKLQGCRGQPACSAQIGSVQFPQHACPWQTELFSHQGVFW